MKRIRLMEDVKPIRKEIPLCTISDDATMNREVFKNYLRQYPKAKKFGFSTKHTGEILAARGKNGASNDLVYNLPVEWNCEKTYII